MSARLSCSLVALGATIGFGLSPIASGHAQPSVVSAGSAKVALPDTPAGVVVSQWLEAFNSGDSTRLRAYYTKYALDRSMDAQMTRRRATGGFDVVKIEKETPLLIELVLQERATGNLAFGVIELNQGSVLGLKQSYVVPVPPGGSVADFKLDAAARARVIEGAIAKLDSNYVFPEVAAKMAASVRARHKRGEYDVVTNGLSFAQLLTEQLQEVSKDKHLRVGFSAPRIPDRRQGPPDSAAVANYRRQMANVNCGFVRAEMLPANTGYLKFNFFADPDVCGPTATAAMNFLANADALIVDLRENGGGDPRMVAYISSYLFSKRTHLNDLWTRRTNETNEFWTSDVPGKRLGDEKPVYVLTANRTFSGAEEFSYNLKNLKRAVIVGETTGGGAHPVSGHKIDDHFSIGVPFARAISPITKTNWEGVGVEPDIKVPAADALATAQKMIAEKRATP